MKEFRLETDNILDLSVRQAEIFVDFSTRERQNKLIEAQEQFEGMVNARARSAFI